MMNDKEILQAVKRLTEEYSDQLGDDAEQIAQKVKRIPEGDPEALRQTANLLMKKLLDEHPGIWEKLRKQIRSGDEENKGATRLGDYLLPGDSADISVGTRMFCPEPGCDYQRSLRQKGQRLFCPYHGTPLVPETPDKEK